MNTLEKLELLKENYTTDNSELDRILGQLLTVLLNRHQQKLKVYDADLERFEKLYGMASNEFYQQFESGTLGDEMDFFEWSGLCELRQNLLTKIQQLEQAL